MSKTTTRIYSVKRHGKTFAMVRAAHPSTSIRHAIRHDYAADVATQDEIVDWLGMGGRIEDASGEEKPFDEPKPKAEPVPQPFDGYETRRTVPLNQTGAANAQHPAAAARDFTEQRREHLVGNR